MLYSFQTTPSSIMAFDDCRAVSAHAVTIIVYSGSVVKNLTLQETIPGSGRSPGEGNSNPLQYSFLENPMDRGAWWASVQRVAKSQTWLSNWTAAAAIIIISHTSDTRYMMSFPTAHLQPSYNKLDSQQFDLVWTLRIRAPQVKGSVS